MKNLFSKAVLTLFVAGAVFSSCSKDETLPTAGFTLSATDVVQYDVVTVTSTAKDADDVEYSISSQDVVVDESEGTIQFLSAGTFTITQTVKNGDGTDETSLDVAVTAPVNTYKMTAYGADAALVGDAYWFSSMGKVQLRIVGEAEGDPAAGLVKVTPVAGVDPFEGTTGSRTYAWGNEGAADTYDGSFSHYTSYPDAWDAAYMMASTAGDGLEVTLLHEADAVEDNVYEIKMLSTSFLGYYTAAYEYVEGESALSFTYRGKITPLAAE